MSDIMNIAAERDRLSGMELRGGETYTGGLRSQYSAI